jgi:hypothetical protein
MGEDYVYDAVLRERINIKDANCDRQSRVRFYMKCLYKMEMKKKRSPATAVDYC